MNYGNLNMNNFPSARSLFLYDIFTAIHIDLINKFAMIERLSELISSKSFNDVRFLFQAKMHFGRF